MTDGADAARAAARAADVTAEVLAQELAAIDAGEALGVSKLRTERYIGLHEVEPHVERLGCLSPLTRIRSHLTTPPIPTVCAIHY